VRSPRWSTKGSSRLEHLRLTWAHVRQAGYCNRGGDDRGVKGSADVGLKTFRQQHLARVVRGALGLGADGGARPLFDATRAEDPTLDLQPSDLETNALLDAIVEAAIKQRTRLAASRLLLW
jgi:hypothetical protein